MHKYTIEGGPVQFGPGEVLGLTPRQFKGRQHLLIKADDTPFSPKELVKIDAAAAGDSGERITCKATGVLAFKAGEVLYLAQPPAKGIADRVVPHGNHDDGRKRVETDEKKKARRGKTDVAKSPAAAAATAGQAPARSEQIGRAHV